MEECREHSDTPTQLEHGPRRLLVGCLAAEAQVARRGTVACAGLRRNSWCSARSSEFQQQYDQRLAVGVITLAAVLAALAALVQIYDSVSGKGSLWNVFVSVGITAWWVTIAIYLSGRRGR